jgi:C-terminal processing protease CtpA/Prc
MRGHWLLLVGWGVAVLAAPLPDLARPIKELGDEKYAVREAAETALVQLAATNHLAVLTECARNYRQTTDPEVRVRLFQVMETVVSEHLFRAPRAFLGIQMQNVFVGDGGALVINGRSMPPGAVWISRVVDESGAAKAGLQVNDFIIGVDTQKWTAGPTGFTEYVQSKRPGDTLKLVVIRGETTNNIEAVLGDLPPAEQDRVYAEDRRQTFFEHWCQKNLGFPAPRPANE